MSKGKAKVEIEEDQSGRLGFENTPKLFSKWSYDEIQVTHPPLRSKIPASSITSQSSPLSLKSLFLTPPADIKPKDSEKLSAPSSKDSSAPCNSMAEIPERKSKLSES